MVFIFSLDIVPLVLLMLIYKKDLANDFKIFKLKWKEFADKYIRYWIVGIVLMSLTNFAISLITSNDVGNNEEAVRKILEVLPIYSIISTCLCAPIAEELAYRKTLKNIFNRKWLTIIMSALIFGGAHVIGTYTTISDILYIIPYGIVGGIFMYIYYDSKNIWTTISLHFIHNTILIITYIISTHL